MSIQVWVKGTLVCEGSSVEHLVWDGRLKAQQIDENTIIVDARSSNRRILSLRDHLKERYPGGGSQQNFVHGIRERAKDIDKAADAIDFVLNPVYAASH